VKLVEFWGNIKEKYPKDKINQPATLTKNKKTRDLHRGINEFKEGYRSETKLVKDENGDLLADSHSNLNMWKHFFSQLLNVKLVRNSLEVTEATENLSEYSVPCLRFESDIFQVRLATCSVFNN
jgi:hypothetical protein